MNNEQIDKINERIKELERQVDVVKSYYLGHAKGGSSREITNRYNEMKITFQDVKVLAKDRPDFIEGYEYAIKVFEKRKI